MPGPGLAGEEGCLPATEEACDLRLQACDVSSSQRCATPTNLQENIFFASILAFQWLYYAEPYYSAMRRGVVFEQFFVFLPYFARPLFPKTRFRDSLNNPSNKSEANATFFFYATWITKIFYVWAKHFIGFGLNYLRFLNKPDAVDQEHMYGLLLWSAFATTISMFLHTLKFKGYLEAKLSFLIYMASYLATFYAIVKLGPLLLSSPLVLAVVAVGAVVNFGPSWAFYVYQIGVLLLLNAVRRGVLDIPL